MLHKLLGTVWVVAGAPGAGKSTFAKLLRPLLHPAPALVDKDTVTNPLVERALVMAGRSPDDRDSDWFVQHLKGPSYEALADTVAELRVDGCSVIVSAPYTDVLHSAGAWDGLCERFGGGDVRLVWVRTDASTLQQRLAQRGLRRDASKLADIGAYAVSVGVDERPVVSCVEIDNRASATASLADQAHRLVAG